MARVILRQVFALRVGAEASICVTKRPRLSKRVRMSAATASSAVHNLQPDKVDPTAAVQDYDALCEKLKEISTLNGVSGLLMWDEMVMMPEGAAEVRASQKSILTGIVYDKQTSPEMGTLLKKVDQAKKDLDEYQTAVLREANREYVKSTAVPKHIEKRRSELESEGYQAWVAARQAKDFSKFAPVLQEWVDLIRERSKYIDSGKPCYDVALQDFEKGMSTARLDEIFQEVKAGLVPFIAKLREKGTAPDSSALAGGPFDPKAQADVCNKIAQELGFDLKNGRLDVSIHPFTGGAHPKDVRMTTRFKSHDLSEGLTGAIHETGHALYEQARNMKYDGLPVNEALSMGIHESQSLLWERMVGLSEPFSQYLKPQLTSAFPQLPKDLKPEQVYKALNVMKIPSLIRVEADEVQYPLHILLRFEIEKSLADGCLDVTDVPRVWNQKMKEYLGVEPKDDGEGCLQDMHWSAGAFAYFPTYLLGAMYACQIFEKAKEELPGLEDNIAQGKFSELRQWLAEKVHSKGSLYPSGDELMLAATGKSLEPSIFLQYLTEKYSKLYQL